MRFSIDHVVIASDDLSAAIANARTAGFTVVPGGVHGSGHTHNALIGFSDGSYLELFAPTPQGRTATHRWFERIRNGGGLVDFCLLGAGLNAEIARIRELGIAYSQPFPMGRVTPAGMRIEWLLSTPLGVAGETGWPFLIEDVTPRTERVPHAPEELRHANGSKGVAGVTVLVRDVHDSSKAFAAILGATAEPHANLRDARRFPITGAWIELREPRSAGEEKHLARHGQGPYHLTLRATSRRENIDDKLALDAALFCGAKIALV